MSKSLSRKFITGVLLLLVVAQGILISWGYFQEKESLEGYLQQKIEVVGSLVRNAAVKGLTEFDVTYFGLLTDETLKDTDFIGVTLSDDSGIVVVDRKKSNSSHVFKKDFPVLNGNDKIGLLTIYYSTHRIETLLYERLVNKGLIQAAILVVTGFLISLSFRFKVVSRIRIIDQALAAMTSGDLTARIRDNSGDEIGKISEGIDELGDRLSSNISDIITLSGNVATVGAEISTTLEQANASLIHQHDATEEISRSISAATSSQTQISVNARKLLEISRGNSAGVEQTLEHSKAIDNRMNKLATDMKIAHSSVSEIEKSANHLSKLAFQAEEDVQKAVAASNEIRFSFSDIERLIEDSTMLSEKTTSIINKNGSDAINELNASMLKIQQFSDSIKQTVGGLGERSKDIGNIISAIAELTDKTKLLALNASIIAAQAGEHGRGFAVVANEMKQLSDKTAQSTGEIAAILESIHKDISNAVKETSLTYSVVKEGSAVVENTGKVFGEILKASESTLNKTKNIKDASTHQQLQLEEIGMSLTNLKDVNSSVSSAAIEQDKVVKEVGRSITLLKKAIEDVSSTSLEQVRSMDEMLKSIEISTARTGDIASAAHEAQQNSGAICASLSEVVTVGSQTVDAITSLAERMDFLRSEVERLHAQTRQYKV